MSDDKKYFATLPDDEIGTELWTKITDYEKYCKDTGLIDIWERSFRATNKSLEMLGTLGVAGQEGEFLRMPVNHYKSLQQHKVSLITKNRPEFEPQAANSDYKSIAQVQLAKGLLDFELRDKQLADKFDRAVEYAIRYGEGWLLTEWDNEAGDSYMVDPNTDQALPSGDIRYTVHKAWNVIRDVTKNNMESNDWFIVRDFQNRYDLIAQYANPESTADKKDKELLEKLQDSIMDIPQKSAIDRIEDNTVGLTGLQTFNSDEVAVYHFYHRKSPSVPNGKYIMFCDADTLLLSGDLPYDKIPLYSVVDSRVDGSNFGSTIFFDCLPIQEMLDGLNSAIATNQKNGAIQIYFVPKGSNPVKQNLAEGLSIIEIEPGMEPKAASLLSTSPEVFEYVQTLQAQMEILSGVNQVTRGMPPPQLKSGTALAMVQEMAIEYASSLQGSYIKLVENVGSMTIDILKTYANTKRVARIVGKSKQSYLKEFTGDDLMDINRVTVSIGSPLMNTIAGKSQVAQDLMQSGLITTGQEYINVLKTGSLESMTEGPEAELILIKDENENLAKGLKVTAVATDQHQLHIMEHKSVISSVSARQDPAIVQATLDHINDHIDQLRNTDPSLLKMLGEQSLAGAPTEETAKQANLQQKQPTAPQNISAVASTGSQSNLPNLPNLPKNPMTGQQYGS